MPTTTPADHERYITDRAGNRIAVVLELEQYRKLLEAVEELEAIRAYDEAKASGDEVIPFDGRSAKSRSGSEKLP